MNNNQQHDEHHDLIMLAEMPAPIDPCDLITVNHAGIRHPQLGVYPVGQYNDYPELGSC